MRTPSLRSYLEFALDAAWQAGRITLGYFQTDLVTQRKADNSEVTLADRQAEEKLRELIGRYWPDHGIIGEEFGSQPAGSRLTWILDPIDGTRSFVHGVPLYSMLIALVDGETPLLGVIHLPALNETVYAAQGAGCYWNGRRAHVSAVDRLSDAVLLASEPAAFAEHGKDGAWQRLVAATPIHRTWGDGYGYALVATGRAEIMLDPAMHLWDCGPLLTILQEAGGVLTDWQGRATIYGGNAIGTNRLLFKQTMKLVREAEGGG
ncbi:MAG: inositol monophosphatase family protein [Chloroflexi bacterium]|nr:inositol monophosphatase family protein [Chloroflexota bacterium]